MPDMTEQGWHQDPYDPTLLRWWDGTEWTEHTQPAGGPAQGQQQASSGQAFTPKSPTLFNASTAEAATTGRMTLQNSAIIKVSLGAPFLVTRGAMIAFQGDVKFAYQGAGAGRFVKMALTSEGLHLMSCEGVGEVFVARHGTKLHLLELGPGEQVSASSRSLLGFDSTVQWNIEKIKAGAGAMIVGGLFNVTLTGPGTVILACDWPLVLSTSEARTLVDPNALVAWSANLQTKIQTSFSGSALIGRGSGEAAQIEFSSGGWVIVEPEPVTISTGV